MSQITPPRPTHRRSKTSPSWRVITADDERMADYCRLIAQQIQPTWSGLERRSQIRVPYPQLVELRPLRPDGRDYSEQGSLFVVGKNLGELGLDFFHQHPLPHRHVVARLRSGPERWVEFVMKISWCRFLRSGWYDSGGRFVKVIESIDSSSNKTQRNDAISTLQTAAMN